MKLDMTAVATHFASLDTSAQVKLLRDSQLLDTVVADKLFGHLAGMAPDRFAALTSALDRLEV